MEKKGDGGELTRKVIFLQLFYVRGRREKNAKKTEHDIKRQ